MLVDGAECQWARKFRVGKQIGPSHGAAEIGQLSPRHGRKDALLDVG